jgi:hypothetical protein
VAIEAADIASSTAIPVRSSFFISSLDGCRYNPQGACTTTNTDGEGIIFDTWVHVDACPGGNTVCPTTSPTLVMGNVMYNNGGHGIEVFNTTTTGIAPITIVNNTMFSNNWDTFNNGTWRANGLSQSSNNIHWINNIAVAVRGSGVTANNSPFLGQQNGNPCPTNNVWKNNLSAPAGENNFDGGSCNTYPRPPNVDTASAGFVNQSTANPNFSLTAGSAAVGAGHPFDLWQQSGGTVDAGACPHNPPGPTISCP